MRLSLFSGRNEMITADTRPPTSFCGLPPRSRAISVRPRAVVVSWLCMAMAWGGGVMDGGSGIVANVVRADPPKPADAKPADAKPAEWHVGDALERQLDLPVGLTWEGIPLRGAVERLGQVQRVGLFLDRRFDPGQTIKLSTRDESLREMLDLLGKRIGARAVRIGPVVYLGPESSADAIATTAAVQRNRSLRALPAGTRARWVARRPWNWPQLSTPRGLIEQLAEDGQFRVAGIDRIPHDLWPAANLPPMTISQRLSLVLAGFDLTFEVSNDGRSVRIVPLPPNPRMRESYTVAKDRKKIVAQMRREAPSARLQESANRVTVDGTWADHDRFRRLMRRESGAPPGTSPGQLYTLRVKNQTVGAVAKTLAGRLGRRLDADRRINSTLRKLVSFEVKDATLDQLLHAVFDPVELKFEIDQERLRVFR